MADYGSWQPYRAAIFLSNTGIIMMEHQCYAEAAATLRDAIELLREAAGPSSTDPAVGSARVHHLLREASDRLANVVSEDKVESNLPDRNSRPMVSLRILSGDLTSDFVPTALQAPSVLRNDVVVIRIDDKAKEADDSVSRFQLDSATILFNYATATRCLGDTTTSPWYDRSVIAKAAHKSYHKAYGILCKTQTSKDYSTTMDDATSIRIHLLAMLTVQNLASSAMELQMPDKAQEYYHLLGGLRTMYRRIELIPSLLNGSRRIAPAA